MRDVPSAYRPAGSSGSAAGARRDSGGLTGPGRHGPGDGGHEHLGHCGDLRGLDFQFNPASSSTPAASATVDHINTNGGFIPPLWQTGDAEALLPTSITLGNTTPYNDVYVGFTFGTSLSFDVWLSGPAVGQPPAETIDGSTFSFSLIGPDGYPYSTGPGGAALTIDVDPSGLVTPTVFNSPALCSCRSCPSHR